LSGVQSSTPEFAALPPNRAMKTTSPAIEMTLLMSGAHVNGPNTCFALRTSPSREYIA
jgi:hypothetical protein